MRAKQIPNNGLRVLFIATGYPTSARPNSCIFVHRSIKELSNRVNPRVIHLRAWLPGRPFVEKRSWDDIPVVSAACPQTPAGKMSHLNARLFARLGWLFLRSQIENADIIHSTDFYSGGFIGSRWATWAGKPHTTHAVGSDINLFLPQALGHPDGKWTRAIDGVACNSRSLMKKLLKMVPDISDPRVIHRGVDTDLFIPSGEICGPQRNLPPVRFLFLGGFHTWDPDTPYYNLKGGHTLLKAWREIEMHVQPSNLLIGGPGIDLGKLKDWQDSLKRPDAVSFCKAIRPDTVPAFMRASDVVVIPSLHEGLPNLANESQACGRPVLGSDAGGIPESIIDGDTGRIFQRGNVEALASMLVWFHKHPTERVVMGKNARHRMVNEFSWHNFSREMLTLFQSAIEKHQASGDDYMEV